MAPARRHVNGVRVGAGFRASGAQTERGPRAAPAKTPRTGGGVRARAEQQGRQPYWKRVSPPPPSPLVLSGHAASLAPY